MSTRMQKWLVRLVFVTAAPATIVLSGCMGAAGPTMGLPMMSSSSLYGVATVPVPVSPYFQQGYESRAFEQERYNKVVIMGPITEGDHVALDPPCDDQVVRLLEKARPVAGGVPGFETSFRNVKGITKELIADYVDPPRVVPLIGPAQLHHAHYKCTVYFEERTNVGWPIPYTKENNDAIEVLYIDLDHFHRVGGPEAAPM
ncbi:MAG: hypothetical protein ACRC46_07160 [Thermoguttaceae bacterium]